MSFKGLGYGSTHGPLPRSLLRRYRRPASGLLKIGLPCTIMKRPSGTGLVFLYVHWTAHLGTPYVIGQYCTKISQNDNLCVVGHVSITAKFCTPTIICRAELSYYTERNLDTISSIQVNPLGINIQKFHASPLMRQHTFPIVGLFKIQYKLLRSASRLPVRTLSSNRDS